jgi:CubicO group peptidase (beta-lactamase class C family)
MQSPGGTWSGGSRLGPGAFGHTGFTGTSFFVSPRLGIYAVLLTNRVALGRDIEVMPDYRSVFHDTVVKNLQLTDVTP